MARLFGEPGASRGTVEIHRFSFYIVIGRFRFLAGDIDMHENQGRLLKIMIIVVTDT